MLQTTTEREEAACAIYTRVSEDPNQSGSSTRRQEANCRSFCAAREWSVVEVFEDVDASAFRRAGGRIEFERLLGQLSSGRFDTVVVWRLDRLSRRTDDFERFWSECQRYDIAIASVTEPIDTSSGVGVAVMRMLITFAGLESTIRSERLKARNKEAAERGEPHPALRGFGYDADMNVIPEEAALIREAARRVLKGESLTAIARDFAGRGLVGRHGRPWAYSSLRNVLTSRRIVGERTYLGKVVATNAWEPVLDPLSGAKVRHAITLSKGARQRRGSHPLLAGIIRCGRCGHILHRNKYLGVYICPESGCGGTGIAISQTEEWVREMVLWRLERRWPVNRRVPTLDDDKSREIILTYDWAADRLSEINNARYLEGTLSQFEYMHLRRNLETRVGERLHSISSYVPPPALPVGFDPKRARQSWPVLSPQARQAVVELEIDHILVHPSQSHGNWTPERLEVIYWQALPQRVAREVPDFAVPPSHASRNRNPDLDPERLRHLYLVERRTVAEIAELIGVGESAVTYRLKEASIQTRIGDERRRHRTDTTLDVATVKQLYCEERLTIAATARVLEVGPQHVQRVLEDNDIPIRPGAVSPGSTIEVLDALYSDQLVLEALERHQVPQRRYPGSIHERFPEPIDLTRDMLEELYLDVGCSGRHIELLTGQPESRVRGRLRLWDIPVRKAGAGPLNRRIRGRAPGSR